MEQVEVVIVGGGPAGAATSIALRERGHSVAVIERTDGTERRIGETLPGAIRKPLSELGVWESFLTAGHSPAFGIRSVWGSDEPYEADPIFDPYGVGWHVDRALFDAMLLQAAERAGADVYRNAELLSCENSGERWHVRIRQRDGSVDFGARLLVDATGRSSALASRLGIRRVFCDHLIGIVQFVHLEADDRIIDDFTVVEAVENGWWYSARLPGSQAVVAYMTDADLHARSSFKDRWQELLGGAPLTGSRFRSVPDGVPTIVAAHSSMLEQVAGKNWIAVGDAALAFDPLSAQGVHHAISSGIRAAGSIAAHFSDDENALPTYAMEVKRSFEVYVSTRSRYYQREQRWPDSMFWSRRHSPTLPRSDERPTRAAHSMTATRKPSALAVTPFSENSHVTRTSN